MATKYVTLKDSNGDTLYPQAVATNLAPGSITSDEIADGAITSAKVADGAITTDKIPNDSIKPYKMKGYATTNTTDTWVPVSTSGGEMQHRIIAPFNADGTVPNSAIDWSSTTRPLYYTGADWATTWTFKYYKTRPQLIFVAWQSSVAMFARIYDVIYKVFQSGSSTITATINTSATTWTITTSNTGVLTVLEMNYVKPS